MEPDAGEGWRAWPDVLDSGLIVAATRWIGKKIVVPDAQEGPGKSAERPSEGPRGILAPFTACRALATPLLMRCLVIIPLVSALACSDAPGPLPLAPADPLAAKAPSTTQRADFTITDAGLSLTSDGKGIYRNGICGVTGSNSSSVLLLAPAGATIPKSQQASCAGIAPRAATLQLAMRHVSDNPHVDDMQSPAGSGTFGVVNIKFGYGTAQATTINSSAACGTAGLRFTSVTYPGSSDVVRVDLGGGLWRMYTRPWPDNKAYCENNGVVTYWHVSFDLTAQIY